MPKEYFLRSSAPIALEVWERSPGFALESVTRMTPAVTMIIENWTWVIEQGSIWLHGGAYKLHWGVVLPWEEIAKNHWYGKACKHINTQTYYNETCASPAERKTSRIVKGTLYANAQLFSRDPLMRTRTCSAHCARGTCRALKRGTYPGREKFKNEGRDCTVIKSIWEKVRAEPEEKLSLQSKRKSR